MANVRLLGFTAVPAAIQIERREANQRELSTSAKFVKTARSRIKFAKCLVTGKNRFLHKLWEQRSAYKNCRSSSFEGWQCFLRRIEWSDVQCSLSAFTNHFGGSGNFCDAKVPSCCACFSCTHSKRCLGGNSPKALSPRGQKKIVNAVLSSGNETVADGCQRQGTGGSSSLFAMNSEHVSSSQSNQEAHDSPSTHVVNIMIDGVSNDSDITRLEAQLRGMDGVIEVWLGSFMEGGIRGGYVMVLLHVVESVASVSLIKEIQTLDTKLIVLPYKASSWTWRGHKINYGVAGCGKPIILVHGFGGNAGHFAKLIPFLSDRYRVYAIDLLGFGASDKPVDANYGPDLWADIIYEFAEEFAAEGAVLIGNSIGSLTSLAAAAKGGSDLFKGLVLLNCAGAMNRKGLTQDDPLIRLLSPVFVAIEYLLQRPRVADFLFNRFRRKENVRKILEEQAYCNKESVTDQLVDILYHPSTQPGAKDVFVKVFTGDPGPRPEALMEEISVPLLLLWGDSDMWTPVNGPVAKYFKELAVERENIKVHALSDVGHCPHDDRPEVAADYILPFLSSLQW